MKNIPNKFFPPFIHILQPFMNRQSVTHLITQLSYTGPGWQGCVSRSAWFRIHFPPGSGSAYWMRFRIQKGKILILFLKITGSSVNLDQVQVFFLLLSNLIFLLHITLHTVIFYKVFLAWSRSVEKSCWIWIRIGKNSWIRICKI